MTVALTPRKDKAVERQENAKIFSWQLGVNPAKNR
jgi:hypothetical protein